MLVFGLYTLAVDLARGARREIVRTIGWAFVVAGVVGLALRQLAESYAVDALVPYSYRAAGDRIWLISSTILSEISWSVILYGAIVILGTIVAGPTRAATAVRRAIAPVLNWHAGVAWGLLAATYLLIVLSGGTHALRTPTGVLVIGALLAAGMVVLRRQTIREFPHAQLPEIGSRARTLRNRAIQTARASPEARVERRPTSSGSRADEILRLRDLRDTGLLTDKEFERGKALVLFEE